MKNTKIVKPHLLPLYIYTKYIVNLAKLFLQKQAQTATLLKGTSLYKIYPPTSLGPIKPFDIGISI